MFSLDSSVEILKRTPYVLNALLNYLSDEWTNCDEGRDTWSAFDVVGHLVHGEKTDWIPRAKIILDDSIGNKKFEPFDRFAQYRDSRGKTMQQLLKEFELLREQNLKTLESFKLSDADLKKKGIHPEFGKVTLEQLIATWAVHDLNHLNQVSRVMAKRYTRETGPWRAYLGVLKK